MTRERALRAAVLAAATLLLGLATAPAAFAQPANDDLGSATVVAAVPYEEEIDTSEATTAADDPLPSCEPDSNANSAWWAYTPSADIRLMTDAEGLDHYAIVSVWTGTAGALAEVACSGGAAVFDATAGTTYYFMTSTCCGEPGGSLRFVLREAPPPLEASVTVDPTGTVDPRTGVATIGGTASCNQPAFLDFYGEMRQRAGRFFVEGFFYDFLECDGTHRWTKQVTGNGVFVGGSAEVRLFAFSCNDVECVDREVVQTVRLRPAR